MQLRLAEVEVLNIFLQLKGGSQPHIIGDFFFLRNWAFGQALEESLNLTFYSLFVFYYLKHLV